jgi:hypothetical protein
MSGALTIPARAVPIATLKSWTPWSLPNPSLLGHATITFSGGWTIRDVPIFRRNDGSLSVGVPNAAQFDRDGRQKTDAAGKRQYVAVLSFETAVARERWQQSVLAALRDAAIEPASAEGAP